MKRPDSSSKKHSQGNRNAGIARVVWVSACVGYVWYCGHRVSRRQRFQRVLLWRCADAPHTHTHTNTHIPAPGFRTFCYWRYRTEVLSRTQHGRFVTATTKQSGYWRSPGGRLTNGTVRSFGVVKTRTAHDFGKQSPNRSSSYQSHRACRDTCFAVAATGETAGTVVHRTTRPLE
jgi:hypothetical protein